MRVGDEPLGGQPGAVEIAARQARAGDVQLAGDARRHRLKRAVQHIDPGVPDRMADRRAVGVFVAELSVVADQIVVSVGPYRLVSVTAAARQRACKLARQRLAADQDREALQIAVADAPSASSVCHKVGVACITVARLSTIALASALRILHGRRGAMTTAAPAISGR